MKMKLFDKEASNGERAKAQFAKTLMRRIKAFL